MVQKPIARIIILGAYQKYNEHSRVVNVFVQGGEYRCETCIFHLGRKRKQLRIRSNFTGYLDRVLGNICLKKSLRLPFLVEKTLRPFFYLSQKQPYLKSWKRLNEFVVCIIRQLTHSSLGFSNFVVKKSLPPNFF